MEKYFVNTIHSVSSASKMEQLLVAFCRKKFNYVLTDLRVRTWLDEIRAEQDRLLAENRRLKPVHIWLTMDPRDRSAVSHITIGEAYIALVKVKGAED